MTPAGLPCPWCKLVQRVVNGQCAACHGAFPPPPRQGPPPAPPPAPRAVPAAFASRCLDWNDFKLGGVILGGSGGLFLLVGVPLVAIGETWAASFVAIAAVSLASAALLLRAGRARLRTLRAVFERGEAVPARIVSIVEDRTVFEEDVPDHLKYPWQIEYEFALGGAPHRGTVLVEPSLWQIDRRPGDLLWLLLHPAFPSHHEFWPPLERQKGGTRIIR
ncbi:MAG: hypothetical protein ABJE95_34585 [Byssovorax sp.]